MSREGSPDQFKPKRTAAQRRIYDMEEVIDAAAKTKLEQVPQLEDAREPDDESVEFAEKDVGDIKNGDEALKKPTEAVKGFASLKTVEGSTAITTAGEDNAKVEVVHKTTKHHLPELPIDTPEKSTNEALMRSGEVYSKTELTEVLNEFEALDTKTENVLDKLITLYPEADNRPFEVTSYINQLQDLQVSIGQRASVISDRMGDTIITDHTLGISYAELQTFIKTTDRAIANLSNVPALDFMLPSDADSSRHDWSGVDQPKIKTDFAPEHVEEAGNPAREEPPLHNLTETQETANAVNQDEPTVEDVSSEKLSTRVLFQNQRVVTTDPIPAKSRFTPTTVEITEQPDTSVFRNMFRSVKRALGAGRSGEQSRPPRKDPSLARTEFIARAENMVTKSAESEPKDAEPVFTGSNSLAWLQRLHGQEVGADIYRSKLALRGLLDQNAAANKQAEQSTVEQPDQTVAAGVSADNASKNLHQELRAELAHYGQDSLEPDLLPEVDEQAVGSSVVSDGDVPVPKSVAQTKETNRSPASEMKSEYEAINAAWDDAFKSETKTETELDRATKSEYSAINAEWDDVLETESESELDIATPEAVERNQALIQAKVTQIERADESGIDSLFNRYQSPYKVLGEKSFQEIQQWVALDKLKLQAILDKYQIKKETFEQWRKLFPELKKQAQGVTNKSFKTVIDEYLLAQKSI